MQVRRLGHVLYGVAAVLAVPALGAITLPLLLSSSIDSQRIVAVAHQHRNFTLEQRKAVATEIQSQLHPQWKNLSEAARLRRTGMFIARLLPRQCSAALVAAPSLAAFIGNQTAISNTAGGLIGLQRQSNCSLSLYSGTYTLGASPTVQFSQPTNNYEQLLHQAAGLSSRVDAYTKGCTDPSVGIGSRRGAFLGKTTQGLNLFASSGYDPAAGSNALYYGTVDPNSLLVQSGYTADLTMPNIAALAAGDLNADGLADVVGIDALSGSVGVWLANASGTLGSPTFYVIPGSTTEAAVLADVNGDGKLDVVVASSNSSGQEQISILTGKGDGTLNAPQSVMVPTLGSNLSNLIAADLRGSGRPDIVGSNGLVLLNNGSGAFTVGTAAFAPIVATSSFGPNLAAGDFNNDDKLDLAVSNGTIIQIYLGNGDGTFTTGKAYTSINDVGYLTATDLDDDGNVDLYVGLANSGNFGGDQFEVNQAYALMGIGDGSFSGAPSEAFVYTGSNVADLNGDAILDAVGYDGQGFTSYLGDGKGGFKATSTLTISPVTINGQSYNVNAIESYALGDINGDGIEDLVYNSGLLVNNASTGVSTPGVFVALGNGQGGFGAPSFYFAPSTLPGNDTDLTWSISNVQLADLNHDGKADLVYNYTTTSLNTGMLYFATVTQLATGQSFQAPQVIPYYVGSSSVTNHPTTSVALITDLNRDGIPDLVFLAATTTHTSFANSDMLQVALGHGDGSFSTPATVMNLLVEMVSGPESLLRAGDMNGDGIADLVVLGSDANDNAQLAILLGNGDGSFKTPLLTGCAAQYLNSGQSIALGDFNGDGKLDVAMFDPYTSTDNGISFGNGDGTLQTITAVAQSIQGALPAQTFVLNLFGEALVADFNGDGKPDMLVGASLLLSTAAASVATPTPDFALTLSSNSATVAPGSASSTTITVTPSGGFTGTVTLACSGLPSGAGCSFSPSSIAITGTAAASSSSSFTTTAATARVIASPPGAPVEPLATIGFGVPLIARRRTAARSRMAQGVAWLGVVWLCAVMLQGCGGGRSSAAPVSPPAQLGTPAGTYTVTITATSGALSHAASIALTVN